MNEWIECKISKGSNLNRVRISPKFSNTISFEALTNDVDISSGLIKIISKKISNTNLIISIPYLDGNKKKLLELKVNRKDIIKI